MSGTRGANVGLNVFRFVGDLLSTYAAMMIPIGTAVLLRLRFPKDDRIKRRPKDIRKKVMAAWDGQYKNLETLFDTVPVEYLRVIGASARHEGRKLLPPAISFDPFFFPFCPLTIFGCT